MLAGLICFLWVAIASASEAEMSENSTTTPTETETETKDSNEKSIATEETENVDPREARKKELAAK